YPRGGHRDKAERIRVAGSEISGIDLVLAAPRAEAILRARLVGIKGSAFEGGSVKLLDREGTQRADAQKLGSDGWTQFQFRSGEAIRLRSFEGFVSLFRL